MVFPGNKKVAFARVLRDFPGFFDHFDQFYLLMLRWNLGSMVRNWVK